MKKSILVAALVALVGSPIFAASRNSEQASVITIPAAKAAKMVNALGKVVKAPRPDAVKPCEPAYPVGSLCAGDLDALQECICLINEQLEEILSRLDMLDLSGCDQIEVIVSQIDQLSACVGCACESGSDSIDFCDRTSVANIDNSNATVIGYLRTILRELRGLVGTADYCLPCTQEECSISDLPADLLCSGGTPTPPTPPVIP